MSSKTKISSIIKEAIEIIENNQYMTIASTDKNNNSWVSPVAYTFDSDFNFFWVSVPSSKHQQNIEHNPSIVFSIFDSHQAWGEGVGLQIEAEVTSVPIKDMPKVIKLYFNRKYPYGGTLGAFGKGLRNLLKKRVYRFYKATPTTFWYPDFDAEVDSRMKIDLK